MPSLPQKLQNEHPSVVQLCKLDDDYRQLENEYAKEWAKLQEKYEALQAPILEKRQKFIEDKGTLFLMQIMHGLQMLFYSLDSFGKCSWFKNYACFTILIHR